MKPTTIIVNVSHYDSEKGFVTTSENAVLATIEGHDVYILESGIIGTKHVLSDGRVFENHDSNIYRESGERIWCAWTYGRTGKSLRWACVVVNAKMMQIMRTTNGMNGATNHGRGAALRFIDWDGSKYAEALETSKRTGKKLLYAF